jgi:hypothetical protein
LLDELNLPKVHDGAFLRGTGGLAICPPASKKRIKSFCLFQHPQPGEQSFAGNRQGVETAASMTERGFSSSPSLSIQSRFMKNLAFLMERQKMFKSLLTQEWFEVLSASRSVKGYSISRKN